MTDFAEDRPEQGDDEACCRKCGAAEEYLRVTMTGNWTEIVCDICGAGECGIAF